MERCHQIGASAWDKRQHLGLGFITFLNSTLINRSNILWRSGICAPCFLWKLFQESRFIDSDKQWNLVWSHLPGIYWKKWENSFGKTLSLSWKILDYHPIFGSWSNNTLKYGTEAWITHVDSYFLLESRGVFPGNYVSLRVSKTLMEGVAAKNFRGVTIYSN